MCGECVHVVNVGDVGVGDECVGVFCTCGVCVCVCVCARACVSADGMSECDVCVRVCVCFV